MILIWILGHRIKKKKEEGWRRKRVGLNFVCLLACFYNWTSKYTPMSSSSRSVADHIVIEKVQTNRAVCWYFKLFMVIKP